MYALIKECRHLGSDWWWCSAESSGEDGATAPEDEQVRAGYE